MVKRKNIHFICIFLTVLIIIFMIIPDQVFGEVKPITEVKDQLENISEEEKIVLEKLFSLTQGIEEMEREEERIVAEIDFLQPQIDDLEHNINVNQNEYESNLEVLKKVLINYQRGGPATYLELLLEADNLTTFLKSINLIKDISRNTGELLEELEEAKYNLEEQKNNLKEKVLLFEQKKEELEKSLTIRQQLKEEQAEYLISLQENKSYYEEQLGSLEHMWEEAIILFAEIVNEFTQIIGEGNFTLGDLNLEFGFSSIKGGIYEETFNEIIKNNANLSDIIFHFRQKEVVIEIPDSHLVITGNFTVTNESSMIYEVTEGEFYDIPLEKASIDELFEEENLYIDFQELTRDVVIIKFILENVESKDGYLMFDIKPVF